jgi:hypothetical protein
MIEERLTKLEEQIEASANLPRESREEMLHLLAALRSEIAALPSGETQLIVPDGEESALSELREKVKELESSHPDLAAAVNRLSIVLSNMGM